MRINSTSKTKKIRVIKKNCKEKFIRLFSLGLNPHSKGLNFSASAQVLKASSRITSIKTWANKSLIVVTDANIIIMGLLENKVDHQA